MTSYSENDWWSFLAHSHSASLAHSWGKKPEQKAAEKEYNHEYYEKNKEKILAARKKHGDKDFEGRKIESQDDIKSRMDDETSELEELMKKNAEAGGYSDEVMENIRQHNQNILDNIKALTDKVNGYINDNPNMSDEQKSELLKSLQTQIDKAREQTIDLSKESSHDYLKELGAERGSSSPSKSKSESSSSSSNSNSSSNSSDDKAEEEKKPVGRTSSNDDTPWWKKGDEKYNKMKSGGSTTDDDDIKPRSRQKKVTSGNGVKIRKTK